MDTGPSGDLMSRSRGWVCPLKSWRAASAGRRSVQLRRVTVLLAELLGAASVDPPALGWGGEGATPGLGLFDPMEVRRKGQDPCPSVPWTQRSYCRPSKNPKVTSSQEAEQELGGLALVLDQAPGLVCHLRGSLGAPASPASRAAVPGSREDLPPRVGPGCCSHSVREGGWGWGVGEQGTSPGSQGWAFGSC